MGIRMKKMNMGVNGMCIGINRMDIGINGTGMGMYHMGMRMGINLISMRMGNMIVMGAHPNMHTLSLQERMVKVNWLEAQLVATKKKYKILLV